MPREHGGIRGTWQKFTMSDNMDEPPQEFDDATRCPCTGDVLKDWPPDPDAIGWSYPIYRSHEGGTFVADTGSFKFDHGERNWTFFRHYRDKGFLVEDSRGMKICIGIDAVRAMLHVMDSRA